jgi:hypothetical protein
VNSVQLFRRLRPFLSRIAGPHLNNFLAEQTTVDAVAGRTTANVLTYGFVRASGGPGVLFKRFNLWATDSFGVGKTVRETFPQMSQQRLRYWTW